MRWCTGMLQVGKCARARQHQRGALRGTLGLFRAEHRSDSRLGARGVLLLRLDLFAFESACHVRSRSGVAMRRDVPHPPPSDEHHGCTGEPQTSPHVPRFLVIAVAASTTGLRATVATRVIPSIVHHRLELTTGAPAAARATTVREHPRNRRQLSCSVVPFPNWLARRPAPARWNGC